MDIDEERLTLRLQKRTEQVCDTACRVHRGRSCYLAHLILLLLLSLLGNHVRGQTIVARPFPFYYQLYSNEVFDIYQDRTGYLWFGMTSALARYDGHYLRTFRSDYNHPQKLGNNIVTYITDNANYLWVGTNSGITLYDKNSWKTSQIEDSRIAGHVVNDIKSDPATGEVWAGLGNHVYRLSPDGEVISGFELQKGAPDTGINQIYIDRQGRVWACTWRGLFVYDKESDAFLRYSDMPGGATPYSMLQDSHGHYWIGTWGEGFWKFNPNDSTHCYEHQPINLYGSDTEDNIFYSMVQDDTFGYLWMLSYNELHAFRCDDGNLTPVDISQYIDPRKMFTKITKDREGNLWLGSYDMGYTIYFDKSGLVNFPMEDIRRTLHHDANILSLAYVGNDRLWVSQDRYGLVIYNLQDGTMQRVDNLQLGEISQIELSKGDGAWVSTRSSARVAKLCSSAQGLYVEEKYNLKESFSNSGNVRCIKEDEQRNLWILTENNIFLHKNGSRSVLAAGREVICPDAIAMDTQGQPWAMKDNDLYRLTYNGQSIEAERFGSVGLLMEGEKVQQLCIDKQGALWMATSLSRLVCSDSDKQQYRNVDNAQSSDGVALSLLANGDRVWLMTSKKLVSFNIHSHKEVVYEANSDNIVVKAFRSSALCATDSGGVFAGGHQGVVYINPERNGQADSTATKFTVSDVLSNGTSFMFDTPDKESHAREVYLPSSCRNIEVRLSSLLYSLGAREQIQYKLDGYDEEWSDLDSKSYAAFYSHLPRGKYHFLVRSQKADGSWSEGEDILLLVRRPAFYESNIAFVIYALLILLALYYTVVLIHKRANMSALHHYHNQGRVERLMEETSGQERAKETPEASPADMQFIKKVITLLEEHIDDTEYGQEQLAQDLLLSRSTLYRKIKTVSGMSPLDFIHNVKMKKACEMLEKRELTISEIAYSLGFSSPKYFTKCFKEEMGQTPSAYQSSLEEEKAD